VPLTLWLGHATAACSSTTENEGGTGGAGAGGTANVGGGSAAGGSGGIAGPSYAEVILADGPIGYYRLNEKSGLAVVDASPSAIDGQYSSTGIELGAPGAVVDGSAVKLDQSGSISVPGASFGFSGTAAFSLEGWFQPQVVDGVRRRLLWRFTGSDGYILENSATTGLRFLRAQNLNESLVSAKALVVQKYSHVVASYDGTKACLYVNGEQAACEPSPVVIGNGVSPLMVSGSSDAYVGAADEIAVYATVLDAATVTEHFQAGTAK